MAAALIALTCVVGGCALVVSSIPSGPGGVVVNASMVEGDGKESLYYATLDLEESSAVSEVLTFKEKNVSMVITCRSDEPPASSGETIEVELHRVTLGLFDDYVSSVVIARNGTSAARWENVGAGDYYFRFVKGDDGRAVYSEDLILYSFNEGD